MNRNIWALSATTALMLSLPWKMAAVAQKIEVAQAQVSPQENKKGLAGVTVTLYRNGGVVEKQTTGSKGRGLNFSLMNNGEYLFVISRSGYYTYRYEISTRMPGNVAANIDEMGSGEILTIAPEMYPKIEGFNPKLFEAPLTRFYYNASRKRFDEDAAYLKLVNARFNECVRAFTAGLEEQKKLIEEIQRKEREEEEKSKKSATVQSGDSGDSRDGAAGGKQDDEKQQEPASGQLYLTISGNVAEIGFPVGGVEITVSTYKSSLDFKQPLKEQTYRTDAKGRFSMELELQKVHKVRFYKSGYYAKSYFVESRLLMGRPFEKSYRFEMGVELIKVLRTDAIKAPASFGVEYDKIVYFKKDDAFGFDNNYAKRQHEAKDLHRFFDEVNAAWEKHYKKYGRGAPPAEEDKPPVTTSKDKEPPPEEEYSKHKSDAAKLAEARANKIMKEEEERRLRAEMEERERLAREEEAQRLRELQEAAQRAMLERMAREAEAAAAAEKQAVREEKKYAAARQVQVAKSERNVQITRELATLDRNLKVKTAAGKDSGKVEKPVIRPVITVKTEDGYFTDITTITVKYPGSKTVYREVTTLWLLTEYYRDNKEIDEETYKKELSAFNIKP